MALTQMFPTDVAGTLAGTEVIVDRFGGQRHGKVMQYQHYVSSYTVPVQLDDGRWTAITRAELRKSERTRKAEAAPALDEAS